MRRRYLLGDVAAACALILSGWLLAHPAHRVHAWGWALVTVLAAGTLAGRVMARRLFK